jgi:hypothetical protein
MHSPPPSHRKHGLGLGKGIAIRRRPTRLAKDTIQGITKNDIRRLARRGGVKRISAGVYDTARYALKSFLRDVFLLVFGGWGLMCRLLVIVLFLWNMGGGKRYSLPTLYTHFVGGGDLYMGLMLFLIASPGSKVDGIMWRGFG